MPFAVAAPHEPIRLRVTEDVLFCRIKPQRAGQARGDVAQVTQRCGEMADFDVCVRPRPALDAIEKIALMQRILSGAAELFAQLVPRPEKLPAAVFAQDQ